MLIHLRTVSKYFGGRGILEDVDLQINPQDRIGLIGRNGVGKTTLFKIVTGELEIDQGQMDQIPGLIIGYLSQDLDFDPEYTLMGAMASVAPEISRLEIHMSELEQQLAAADPHAAGYEQLLGKYGSLQHEYEWRDGYSFQAKIQSILNGMGFPTDRHHDRVAILSGGEKMRLNLARLLLQEPDLLLLDEPNNHLDLDTLEWVETYLQKWKKAMMVISHDRDFLDHVVNRIAELEEGRLTVYSSDYSGYLKAKEERLQLEEKALRLHEDKVKRMNTFINRFRYKATKARQVQSKEKALQKLDPVTVTHVPKKRIKVRFHMNRTSEAEVLMADSLSKSFGEKSVFSGISFSLRRGERVGILGPNGIGKSTLLKILVGQDEDYQGRVEMGSRVSVAYFQQDLPLTSENHSVLAEIMELGRFTEKNARDLAGLFLFTGEDVYKTVGDLSGGERNRLLLAKLVSQQANLLVLDEPTNHLDIETREVLEAALADYSGTVILVSHDRYFLRRITNRIFVMTASGLEQFPGSYSEYMEHLAEKKAQAEAAAAEKSKGVQESTAKKPAQRPEALRREQARQKQLLADLEAEIAELEEEKVRIEKQMASEETYQDGEKAKQTIRSYNRIQEDLNRLYRQWELYHDPA